MEKFKPGPDEGEEKLFPSLISGERDVLQAAEGQTDALSLHLS